jgi:ubiquinol oxidase
MAICADIIDSYHANLSHNYDLHHKSLGVGDTLARWFVKFLRVPMDLFFRKKYGHRAVMLETIAAVPVGGHEV